MTECPVKNPQSRPQMDLPTARAFLLYRHAYPNWYATELRPWEQFIAAPTWRVAKALLKVDADSVVSIVERIVAEVPGSRERSAWLCLGKVRQYRGNHQGAIEAFAYLAERDRCFKALYNVGVCHAALGEYDRARQAFLQVLELRSGDALATEALGRLPS